MIKRQEPVMLMQMIRTGLLVICAVTPRRRTRNHPSWLEQMPPVPAAAVAMAGTGTRCCENLAVASAARMDEAVES
jgi:hypothetical protein